MMLIDRVGVLVAVVVSLTLLLVIVIAKVAGSLLPVLVKKIGLDPAVMASPLITTIVDAVALVVYFVIAKAVLGL